MLKRGKRPVILKGYHGQVSFMLQDYVDKCGHRNNYLALSNQFLEGRESVRLRAFICKYSNQLSYKEVANLVKEVAGFETVSGQHCFNIVQSVANAVVISQEFAMGGQQLHIPFLDSVDLYDKQAEEFLIMEDAVGVKRQKEVRNDINYEKSSKTVQTDVLLVQNGINPDNNSSIFSVFVAQKEHRQHLENQLMCHLSTHHKRGTLPIVVIADGARTIRKKLTDLLGNSLIFILDWYHLSNKIWQYMSQIALDKTTKELQAKAIVAMLWKGQVVEAISYLKTYVTAKNETKKIELIDYLVKHQSEIVNYEKRKSIGKKIGSGCVEKANDLIVAHRQKKKGMAWSNKGSESLAILKALEINQQWKYFWSKAA